jgi:hypothetical protein
MMSAAKSRASGSSVGKNSTMQSQSFSSTQWGSNIVSVLRSRDRQISFFRNFSSKPAIHRRYTQRPFLNVCYNQNVGHGQMLRVVGLALGTGWQYFLTVSCR